MWGKQNFSVNEGQVRIRHTKPEIYRWHCSERKKFGTPFGSYLISFIFISTLFLYCVTPMEHFFKRLILHVWLKSIILVFANILNTFFSFVSIVFISKQALHNWFYTLIENWCRNTQSVRNKVIHKNYVFFVTFRSRKK